MGTYYIDTTENVKDRSGAGIRGSRAEEAENFTTEATKLAEAKTWFLCSLRCLDCLRYRIFTSVSNRRKFVYVACPSMRVRPARYSSFMSSGRNMSNRAWCV